MLRTVAALRSTKVFGLVVAVSTLDWTLEALEEVRLADWLMVLLLALTIGTALLGIVTVGSVVGSMLPLLLRLVGYDPAVVSVPLIAALVDVTGIVVYFSVAYLFLRGTIL